LHSEKISKRKEIKGIQIVKEEVKLSLFADDKIQKIPPKNTLQNPIITFDKVASYKINIQKLEAFPHINNKRL
jgi:hypothetical protein